MAGERESRHVRGGVHPVLQGEAAGHVVQPLHLLEGRLQPRLVELVHLEGVDEHARAQGLGEEQAIARPGPGVGEQAVWIGQAHHREAVLELLVAHRVTAQQHGAGLGQGLGSPLKNAAQGLRPLPFQLREAAEVEGEERTPAHGVDVREGVGRRHPAETAGVVAHRSDEVGGGHQGMAIQEVDPGVVRRLRTDEDPLISSGEPDERGDHR